MISISYADVGVEECQLPAKDSFDGMVVERIPSWGELFISWDIP